MKRAISLVALSPLLLAGCGQSDTERQELGSQSYADPQQMADDLTAGGIACEMTTDADESRFGANSGRCTTTESELVLLTFDDDSDRDEYQRFVTVELPSMFNTGTCLLTGPNWAVNCGMAEKSFADQLQSDVFGGDLVYLPSQVG
ncbi:MAG: hypothetical protein WBB07_02855 [Mycobacterium sp.]